MRKRERLRIYKQMLADYIEKYEEIGSRDCSYFGNFSGGFCLYLSRLDSHLRLDYLIELKKPRNNTINGYWWPSGNLKLRIAALRRAIKKCES